MTQTLRIVRLEVDAFKRIRAASIKPDGSMVQITGRNAQGKSSILDAIAAALGGGSEAPDKPIRNGNKKATIRIDLGELMVERSYTPSGGSLTVTPKDGAPIKSPQAVLDKLVGSLTFDPMRFERMEPRQQVQEIKTLAGLDAALAKVEEERTAAVKAKTEASSAVKTLETQLEGMPADDGPTEETSVSTLADEMGKAMEKNATNAKARKWLAEKSAELVDSMAEHSRILQQLGVVKAKIDACEKAINEQEPKVKAMTDIDLAEIRTRMANIESANAAARRRRARTESVAKLEDARKALRNAIRRVEEAEFSREHSIKTAKLPVKGLGFDDQGVTLNGFPFAQASSAERIRASVAMGLASNPTVRVMLVREGSLLDSDGLALLGQIADEYSAQVWVERVTNGEQVGIVIEDGEVREGGAA